MKGKFLFGALFVLSLLLSSCERCRWWTPTEGIHKGPSLVLSEENAKCDTCLYMIRSTGKPDGYELMRIDVARSTDRPPLRIISFHPQNEEVNALWMNLWPGGVLNERSSCFDFVKPNGDLRIDGYTPPRGTENAIAIGWLDQVPLDSIRREPVPDKDWLRKFLKEQKAVLEPTKDKFEKK